MFFMCCVFFENVLICALKNYTDVLPVGLCYPGLVLVGTTSPFTIKLSS